MLTELGEIEGRLDEFYHLAGAQAAGADLDRRLCLSQHCLNFEKIRLPDPASPVLCVAHLIAGDRSFTAYVTLACH